MEDPVSNVGELVELNRAYAPAHDSSMVSSPSRRLAVVACMDCRLDIEAILGLEPGEAHVMRNAGGVITDDMIRSLCLSQRALGTSEIILIHHTKCGVQGLDEDAFRSGLLDDVGEVPSWSFGGFADAADDVRASIVALETSPFVPHTDRISGFVFDVDTGLLEAV